MRKQREGEAVTPVIGIILMVALTVVLAAVTGVFVFNITGDMSEGVQAGASANFNAEKAEVLYISNKNAEYLEVTFSGWGDEGTARLNKTGARATLNTSALTTSGDANVTDDPTSFPTRGDDVTITVVAVRGSESTVILDRSGRI